MIHLEQIVLRELRLPLKEPFRISTGIQTVRRIGLVEVVDVDGVRGWGECVAQEQPNYSPETIDTAWLAIKEWLAPRLLAGPFEAPGDVMPLLDAGVRGHRMAKAALEMAVWALEAERREMPLARLLGGTRERVATGISVGIQDDPEVLAERVGRAVAAGYRKIKLKVKPGADVAYLRAVRAAHGDALPLMVDANSAYTLDDRATLEALDDFGLLMIEQPLGWDDLVQHAALQKHMQTPLCLDESITSLDRAREMLELGSGRIINVKPGRVGGLAQAVAIHDLCHQAGVDVWCGGMLESGIGRAHNVALASLPGFTLPGDLSPSARYWEQDIVTPEWTMDADGMVPVPLDKPGLGVDLDLDRIDALTVREDIL